MTSRLEEFAKRVTREIYHAMEQARISARERPAPLSPWEAQDFAESFAAAVLERETRAFFHAFDTHKHPDGTPACDRWLDASPIPAPNASGPPPHDLRFAQCRTGKCSCETDAADARRHVEGMTKLGTNSSGPGVEPTPVCAHCKRSGPSIAAFSKMPDGTWLHDCCRFGCPTCNIEPPATTRIGVALCRICGKGLGHHFAYTLHDYQPEPPAEPTREPSACGTCGGDGLVLIRCELDCGLGHTHNRLAPCLACRDAGKPLHPRRP